MCIFCTESASLYYIVIFNLFYIYTDAPIVIINPAQSPYTVGVGTRLFLHCKALGYPTPTVQWYKGKRKLPVVPFANYFQQWVLVGTDKPGSTVYTCIGRKNAENTCTKHAKSASITVMVKGQNLSY